MLYLRNRRPNRLYSLPNLEEKCRSVHTLGRNAVIFQGYAVQKVRKLHYAQILSYSVFSPVSTREWSLRLTRFQVTPLWKRA